MSSAAPPSERALRFRIIMICFVARNLATGLGFGTFGPLLRTNELHFGVSRTLAATGMSMITIAIGLLSPLIGGFLVRLNLRNMMMAGALISAIGYAGLAFLPNYSLALAMYVLVGTGICLCAVLGPLTLVTRWVDERRGRALSIVNLPLVLLAAPYLVANLLPVFGRLALFAGMALLFVALIPLLALIVEQPSRAQPSGPALASGKAATEQRQSASPLGNPAFWLLSTGIGIIAGSGLIFVVHIVPFGVGQSMSLPDASSLLSSYAAAGMFGTLLFGWLADRITPPLALMISAITQAAAWWLLLAVPPGSHFLIAIVLGICTVPLVTLHGAAMSVLFGVQGVGKAMGYSYAVKLPFLIGAAPMAALLFERTGGYQSPFYICVAGLLMAAVLFAGTAMLAWTGKRPEAAPSF